MSDSYDRDPDTDPRQWMGSMGEHIAELEQEIVELKKQIAIMDDMATVQNELCIEKAGLQGLVKDALCIIDSLDNVYFRDQSVELAHFDGNGLILPSNHSIYFSSGTTITDEGSNMSIDRGLKVHGNVYPDDNNARTCGSDQKKWSGGWFEDINVDDLTCNDTFGGCGSISGCAYIEVNLLEEEKIKQRKIDLNTGKKDVNYTGFELGDVLCYGSHGLKLSEYDCSMCVTAVSDKNGNPIVIGAESIKVVGKVAINQFLVTSSIEGVARAWDNKNGEPPRGCVIGQSMEFKEDNKERLIKAMIRKF